VQFNGGALSRAAVHRMVKVLHEVERRSGLSRKEAGAFATHQPNPRLVTLLAKQLKGAGKLIYHRSQPPAGILGASTCGAALHAALQHAALNSPRLSASPIFLASLGPGLLFGGRLDGTGARLGWTLSRARILCHANPQQPVHLEGARRAFYPDLAGAPRKISIEQTMQTF